MSENKHTPEPLGYGEDNDGWYVEKNGVQIAHGLSEKDASRIVACVNACYGMSDEQVSHGLVSASVFSSVVDQRDRLLSSLKRFADYPGAVCQADYDIARAAIASVKGGAA